MLYFKHIAGMNEDVKIKRLISRFGIEAYGLYCLILELIVKKITTEEPLPFLEESCDDLAEFYGGNATHIEELVNFMINQGLLEFDEIENLISCKKIYKYLEKSQTRSEKIRELIESFNEKNRMRLSQTVSGKSDRTEQNYNRTITEEKRKDEISLDFIPPSENEVGKYISKLKQEGKVVNFSSQMFVDYYSANGWKRGSNKISDWKAVVRTWVERNKSTTVMEKPLTVRARAQSFNDLY